MKKILMLGLSLLMIMTALSGCSGKLFSGSDKKRAENMLEQIVFAIENKDARMLKSLFSDIALEECIDIDRDIEYVFNYFKGDFVSSKESTGDISYSKINFSRYKKAKYYFIVTTTEKEYLLFFIDITESTSNPKNEGLYMLQIIEAKDREKYFTWGSPEIAGIYRIPEN